MAANYDLAAVRKCVAAYGDLVWTLALKFTDSREQAEAATETIFNDIWLYVLKHGDIRPADGKLTVASIALKRLLAQQHLRTGEPPPEHLALLPHTLNMYLANAPS